MKLVVILLPCHWWCHCWDAVCTQDLTLCEKIQFSFTLQRFDWTMSFGRRKSIQGTTRGKAFLFCQGPVHLAFPSNLETCWSTRDRSPLQGSCCCWQWQAAQPCTAPWSWGHMLPFSSASPHHHQSWENTLGTWKLKGARMVWSSYYPLFGLHL